MSDPVKEKAEGTLPEEEKTPVKAVEDSVADLKETVEKVTADFKEEKTGIAADDGKLISEDAEASSKDVEETVADLKKKIQEISSEEKQKTEEKEGVLPELKIPELKIDDKKIAEARENTEQKISESVSKVKEKASDFVQNTDVQKTMTFLKNNATRAVQSAQDTLVDFAEQPQVKGMVDQLSDAAADLARKVNEAIPEDVQKSMKETGQRIAQEAREAGAKAKEVLSSPEVQKTVQDAKKNIDEAVKKGSEAVRDFFDSSKKE